jgi:single-strand DNA-binding protein
MSDLNLTTIVGRLVREPEVRSVASGLAVGSFCLAVNHGYQDKDNQWQEERAFVPCTALGRCAEGLEHRHKGDTLLVIGRLRTDSWQKDGVNHNRLVLVVRDIQWVQQPLKASRSVSAAQSASNSADVPQTVPF